MIASGPGQDRSRYAPTLVFERIAADVELAEAGQLASMLLNSKKAHACFVRTRVPIRCIVRNLSDAVKKESPKEAPPAGIPYSNFVLGVPKESFPGEKRVATTPAVVAKYVKQGLRVVVEKGAGEGASIADAQYIAAGAKVDVRDAAFSQDMVFKVQQLYSPEYE